MIFPLPALVLGCLLLPGSDPERITNTQTVLDSELHMRVEAIKRSKFTMAEKGKRLVELINPGMSAQEVEKLLGKPKRKPEYMILVFYDYPEYNIRIVFVKNGPQGIIGEPDARIGAISVQYGNEPPRRKANW